MNWDIHIAVLGVGLPVLGAIILTAWRAGSWAEKLFSGQANITKRIEKLERNINNELQNNSGNSLRDKIELALKLLEQQCETKQKQPQKRPKK